MARAASRKDSTGAYPTKLFDSIFVSCHKRFTPCLLLRQCRHARCGTVSLWPSLWHSLLFVARSPDLVLARSPDRATRATRCGPVSRPCHATDRRSPSTANAGKPSCSARHVCGETVGPEVSFSLPSISRNPCQFAARFFNARRGPRVCAEKLPHMGELIPGFAPSQQNPL